MVVGKSKTRIFDGAWYFLPQQARGLELGDKGQGFR